MLRIANLRFFVLYGFLIFFFVLVLLAAFVFHGILSWSVGLIYIAYDSFIQILVIALCSRSLKDVSQEFFVERLPTVSAVVPARNEKEILGECLSALQRQSQTLDEIIVVDDGSTDGTIDWLKEHFQLNFEGDCGQSCLQSNLKIIRKPHSGKADSLNAGWRLSSSEIVFTVDADTILEPNAILELSRAFARDPKLAAAGGILRPHCARASTANLFEFYQTFEYIRSFLERFAWMSIRTLVLVSGAFSAFRRDVLEQLGGFNRDSQVEDYELIYRLYRHSLERRLNLNVQVVPQARATTDAPSNVRNFLHQRRRWFAGFLETLFRNKDMIANPRYGCFGRFMLPLKLVDTLKPMYGLIALGIFLGYLAVGLRLYRAILYVLAAKLFFDLAFHCYAFVLYHRWQGKKFSFIFWVRSLLAILTEPFAFQILRHFAAVFGVVSYLRGRIEWTHQRSVVKKETS